MTQVEAQRILRSYGIEPFAPTARDILSPRERQVMEAYARLATQKAVAHALGIAESTVKNTTSAVYRRLGATNSIEAFTALGWLSPRPWGEEPHEAPITEPGSAYWTVRAR